MWKKVPAGIVVAVLAAALVAGAMIARKSLDTPTAADQKPARGSVTATR